MLVWNTIFYALLAVALVVLSAYPAALTAYFWTPYLFGAACLTRVNELVFAFYGDALPKKPDKKHKGLPIKKRGRIILLTLAYIEIIGWFGLIYAAIESIYPGHKPFAKSFESLADPFFVSGVTLTTLGSSEFYAVRPWSRFVTLYEALIGIVFIALGLAAYLGSKDRDQPASPPAA